VGRLTEMLQGFMAVLYLAVLSGELGFVRCRRLTLVLREVLVVHRI
jgi:hypothetical protein